VSPPWHSDTDDGALLSRLSEHDARHVNGLSRARKRIFAVNGPAILAMFWAYEPADQESVLPTSTAAAPLHFARRNRDPKARPQETITSPSTYPLARQARGRSFWAKIVPP